METVEPQKSNLLETQDWGLIEYPQAEKQQIELLHQVDSGSSADTLVFCKHPSLITCGRSTEYSDLQGWTGEIYESQRGGRVTYHGPSQVVIYPIVDLKKERPSLKSKDVIAYLHFLEKVMAKTLQEFDIEAVEGRTLDKYKDLSMTGVWVEGKKLVSIGVAVKKWVAYHGLAINWEQDEKAFSGINPCGFSKDNMISMEKLGRNDISQEEFKARFASEFIRYQ